MNRVIKHIHTVFFSDFNGIQIFWSPGNLIYLINSSSILAALTSALSYRMHFMPLFIFLVVFAYLLFVTVKISFAANLKFSDYLDQFIELNISMLALMLISLIIYAISAFMLYFYGIDGTLKPTLLMLFKAYTSLVIFNHYLFSLWLKPFYTRNYGRQRALRALYSWFRKNKMSFIRYSLMILLLVLAAIKVFQIILSLVLMPIIDGVTVYTGFNPQLKLNSFYDLSDVAVNLFVLILALLISNLVFYPLVYGVNYLAKLLLPIETRSVAKHA